MAIEEPTIRSRRAILAAAAAGAAGLAASAIVAPLEVAAAPGANMLLDQDNLTTTAVTSITQSLIDTGAFRANGNGAGTGVEGRSPSGDGVLGAATTVHRAGVSGLSGDVTGSSHALTPDMDAGVYGWANTNSVLTGTGSVSTGIWGESDIGIGVAGDGHTGIGVAGSGLIGLSASGDFAGVVCDGPVGASILGASTGLHAHVGGEATYGGDLANVALQGTVENTSQIGLAAYGRIVMPNRSGQIRISKGKTSGSATVSGVRSSNFAIATMSRNQSGRWVRAVVCATNKVTVYLNTKASGTTYVTFLVLG